MQGKYRYSVHAFAAALSLAASTASRGEFGSITTTRPASKTKSSADSKPIARDSDSEKTPSKTSESVAPKSTPAKSAKPEKASTGPTPRVEVYIPSIANLVEAAQTSRTADLLRAFSDMIPTAKDSSSGVNFQTVLNILKKVSAWPDTSIVFTTYTQDREGRPRWALKIDWPLDEVQKRITEILDDDNGRQLLKDVHLRKIENDTCQLELPDMVLALLTAQESGCLISSVADLTPPGTVFGQSAPDQPKTTAKKMLLYCRLNLQGNDEDDAQSASPFAMIGPFNDLRYGIALRDENLWSERLNLGWNFLVGAAIKTAVKKVSTVFDCPAEAYVNGAINIQTGGTLAEELADLPQGTLDGRVDDDMAVSVVPGTGFLPLPDVFFQFNASGSKRIIKSIRQAIEKDNEKRSEDDLPVAWHEKTIDDCLVFWKVDQNSTGGIMPASFRPVVFFEPPREGQQEAASRRLIIASTTTSSDELVHRWLQLKKNHKALTQVPQGENAHWQIIVLWKQIYALLQPYLAVLTFSSDGTRPAPSPGELSNILSDSRIQLKIDVTGLDVRHVGPIPIGAAYVPAVVAMSLSSTAGASSESTREQIACQHLRTFYHHAKLFKKDYRRWPANVSELDGYIDFRTHPELLTLHPRDRNLMGSFTSIFTARREAKPKDDERKFDDSLYEIDVNDDRWQLQFRKDEFVHYATISIDQDGEIHRIKATPTPATEAPAKSKKKSQDNG